MAQQRPSLRDKMRSLFGTKEDGASPLNDSNSSANFAVASGQPPASATVGGAPGLTPTDLEPKRVELDGLSSSGARLDASSDEKIQSFKLAPDALEDAPDGDPADFGADSFGAATASWGSGGYHPGDHIMRNPALPPTASWGSQGNPADTTSFGSGWGGANGATASFGSAVTDFDYITSPGAQAERNEEYRDALYHGVGYGHSPWNFGAGGAGGMSDDPDKMQAQAAELEAQAAQLMAQALQAKAQALRMQSGGGPCGSGAGGSSGAGHAAANHAAMGMGMPPMGMGMPPMGMGMPPMGMGMPNMMYGMPWPGGHNAGIPGVNPTMSQGQGRKAERKGSDVPQVDESERTTVMLRNLPNDYTRAMLLELLDQHGFAKDYDFVYLPMDFKRKAGLGYGFVNMVSHVAAQRAFDKLQGFSGWERLSSAKVLEVAWGHPFQGLTPHVERYRNSPVMHEDVPDEFRPLLFNDGKRIAFPPPTRKLRPPRVKGGKMPDDDEVVMQ